jgi:hypothetical protein
MHDHYWIIGAGRFGRLACQRLLSKHPAADILVVDRQKAPIPSGVSFVVEEAVSFLRNHLTPQTDAWIIPAVPIHLAYEWLTQQLRGARRFDPHPVPDKLLPNLPNASRGPDGQVYLSNADFRCPDDCAEPSKTCPFTRRPRPQVMHAYLSRLVFEGYSSVVVRSFQLAPGLGGFKAATLWELAQALPERDGRFLLSTACKCHAVMNAFTFNRAIHAKSHF